MRRYASRPDPLIVSARAHRRSGGRFGSALHQVRYPARLSHLSPQKQMTMEETKPELAQALEWIKRAAENGYADAQFELGRACEDGRGVPQNWAQAANWYRKAAEQGHARAQCALALLIELGRCPPSAAGESIKWFRSAAAQGYAEAEYQLALLHAKGLAGEQQFAEAAEWYQRAAEQGHARAQMGLGSLYFLGLGVLQDYVQAHMWLNLAAASLPRGRELDQALELRNRVGKLLGPEALVEAHRLARAWQARHRTATAAGLDPVERAAAALQDSKAT